MGGGSGHTTISSWFTVFGALLPKLDPIHSAGGSCQGGDQLGGKGWRVGVRIQGDPQAPGLDLCSGE